MKIIIPIIVAILLVGGIVFWATGFKKNDSSERLIKISADAEKRSDGNPWVKGNAQSTIIVKEFSDFQCPACAAWETVINEIYNKYQSQVRFEYRNFPLTTIHDKALAAAWAAEAAGRQGKFWEMHDLLFKNQTKWALKFGFENTANDYAKQLNLNLAQFKKDYKDRKVKDIVDNDIQLGNDKNISATPTFYINDEKVVINENDNPIQVFDRLITAAIDASDRKK